MPDLCDRGRRLGYGILSARALVLCTHFCWDGPFDLSHGCHSWLRNLC